MIPTELPYPNSAATFVAPVYASAPPVNVILTACVTVCTELGAALGTLLGSAVGAADGSELADGSTNPEPNPDPLPDPDPNTYSSHSSPMQPVPKLSLHIHSENEQ